MSFLYPRWNDIEGSEAGRSGSAAAALPAAHQAALLRRAAVTSFPHEGASRPPGGGPRATAPVTFGASKRAVARRLFSLLECDDRSTVELLGVG
jgi:hypothetical protein